MTADTDEIARLRERVAGLQERRWAALQAKWDIEDELRAAREQLEWMERRAQTTPRPAPRRRDGRGEGVSAVTPEDRREKWRRATALYRIRHGLHRSRAPGTPGIPVPTAEQEDEAVRLYRLGLTVAQVATEIGMTYDQCHGALRRYGVEMRPRGTRGRAGAAGRTG